MQMPEEWGDLLSRRMRINPLSSVGRGEETAKALKGLQCKSAGQAGVNSIQCLQGKVLPWVLGVLRQQLCPCFFKPLVLLVHVLSCSPLGSSCLHSPCLEEQREV